MLKSPKPPPRIWGDLPTAADLGSLPQIDGRRLLDPALALRRTASPPGYLGVGLIDSWPAGPTGRFEGEASAQRSATWTVTPDCARQ